MYVILVLVYIEEIAQDIKFQAKHVSFVRTDINLVRYSMILLCFFNLFWAEYLSPTSFCWNSTVHFKTTLTPLSIFIVWNNLDQPFWKNLKFELQSILYYLSDLQEKYQKIQIWNIHFLIFEMFPHVLFNSNFVTEFLSFNIWFLQHNYNLAKICIPYLP